MPPVVAEGASTLRPTVLWTAPEVYRGVRSVGRMIEASRPALESFAEVVEIPGLGPAQSAESLARFQALRPRLDCVYDLTGLAFTGPLAPEVPVLLWPLGDLVRGANLLSNRRRYLKSTDGILLNCTADRAVLERVLGTSAPPAHVVPWGVDLACFRPAEPAERTRLRRALGIADADIVVTYSGRVNIQKNLHHALYLIAAAVRSNPRIRWVIAGAEDDVPFRAFAVSNRGYRARLDAMVRDLGIGEHVLFVGALEDADLALLLGSSDLFLSLSINQDETYGLAVAEAAASGLPSLVTDWGGYRDLVVHGTTGYRIPTYFTGAGVRAAWRRGVGLLVNLAADRARRSTMAAAARAWAETAVSPERFRAGLEEAVRAARERRGQSPVFGHEGFQFHPLARKRHAHSALRHMAREKTGEIIRATVDASTYDTYRFFSQPYASEDVADVEVAAEDRPALLVEVSLASDGVIESHDPIWPLRVQMDYQVAHALLAADGVTTIRDLANRQGGDVATLVAAAGALVRSGILDHGRPSKLG